MCHNQIVLQQNVHSCKYNILSKITDFFGNQITRGKKKWIIFRWVFLPFQSNEKQNYFVRTTWSLILAKTNTTMLSHNIRKKFYSSNSELKRMSEMKIKGKPVQNYSENKLSNGLKICYKPRYLRSNFLNYTFFAT